MQKPEHVDRPGKGSIVAESTNDTVARAHLIAIEVRDGVVVDVANLPPGVRYEIKDWDDEAKK
jgi:hypothetical protein